MKYRLPAGRLAAAALAVLFLAAAGALLASAGTGLAAAVAVRCVRRILCGHILNVGHCLSPFSFPALSALS